MKSIYEKRYISEAQARKAAQAAGCSEIIKDGKMWRVKTPGELTQAAPGSRQESEAALLALQAGIEAARTEGDIAKLYERLNAAELEESVQAALDDEIGRKAAQIESEAALTQAQITAAPGNKPGWVHASSVMKPTKMVWAIADEMYAAAEAAGKEPPSRKEVQAECVRRGIASGTARTQFQHWFKCRNEAAAAPRAQIGADGKIIPAK
jgi:hypothetical protein